MKNTMHAERKRKVECERQVKLRSGKTFAKLNVQLCVTILNQISDSEHYSVDTNRIDLETDCFLKNEDCRVLIFNSPHFISNEILYTSTATCRYLKDDIICFSIKAHAVV